MKYCPNCINEYRDGIEVEVCPDCGVPLLDGENPRFAENADETKAEDSEELVELTRVTEQWQVDFLRESLEEEGIETSQTPGEQSTLLHLPPVEVTGMIKIFVAEADQERALAILKQIDADADNELSFCPSCYNQVDKNQANCPHCGFSLNDDKEETPDEAE